MNNPGLAPRMVCVLALLSSGCNNKLAERPPTATDSVPSQGVPVSSAPHPAHAIISEAASRLRAAMPPSGNYSILLVVSSGEAAAGAAAELRKLLEQEPRVRFARVTQRPAGPAADPSVPGGHVNTVESLIEPRPDVVVNVSEVKGLYYLAAREPGADPLGPPQSGWLWMLSGP